VDPHNVKADTAETDEIVEDTQGVDVATRDGISAYRGRKDLFVATVKRMDAAAFCKTVTKILRAVKRVSLVANVRSISICICFPLLYHMLPLALSSATYLPFSLSYRSEVSRLKGMTYCSS
jgi:hypothetical protein